MAQHDYNIANQTGANFRTDLNNALLAISSNNSGSSEPSTMYAYEWWIDTSNNVLKLRNSSNNAWITMPFSITADNTVDINAGTVNGITSLSFSSGATVTSILDEDNLGSDSATALATQQSIKAYVDSQVTAQDLDISDGSSTIAIDLDSETLSLLGGTGVTSTASGNSVTFAIGQSVGTSDNVVFNQVTGALVGNASTATALATARTISGVSFDGTANITLDTDDIGEGTTNKYFTAERVDDQVNTLLTAGANISLTYDDSAGTLTIANTNSADITSVVAGDGLTGGGTSGDVTLAVGVDDSSIEISSDALRVKATGITNAMLAGSIANAKLSNSSITVNSQAIALGGSHTFDTDDIGEGSSNLYYTDTRVNSAIDARVTNTFINNLSGVVADTATALATGRTIGLSGDVTATGVSFDGTGNITLSTTIAANSVALGTDTTGNYVSTIAGTTNEIEVSGSGSETATVTIGLPDDVTIAGNLTVNGTTTTVNSDTLAVTDPLIKLAKANSGADSLDIGFYGLYDTSGSQDLYAGLFRDANDSGKFKLFKDLQVEPTTTVNTSGTGYAVGTLVSNLEGNVTGNVTGQVSTLSNHDTDNLSEGSSNLYFTNARSRSAISATGDISYNSSTGVISFTQATAPVTSVNSATGAVTLDTDDIAEGSSNLYFTNARADTRINLQTGSNLDLSSKSTSDLSEGTNLYYTDTRFDTRLGTKTTDNLTEGSSNLYMTTERVQDIVGGMVTGNTETGITVTYDDSDGTLDFVVGTLNQDTTGNAATATALQTARTIGGVSFDGTGNIDLAGVNTSGNQDTSGNSATATALATGRNFSITGDITASAVSFDGTGNVTLSAGIDANTVGISELNVSDGSNGQVLTTDGAGNLSFSTASGTTINNNADNRVITGSGSSNTLNGESGLTYDGSALSVTGTINNVGILADATNFTDSILISQNASTGTLSSASDNTGLGDNVFSALTSGLRCTAIGSQAGASITTASEATLVGRQAGTNLTTGNSNTFIGGRSGLATTEGTENTAVGQASLFTNTTGDSNTAIGRGALLSNTTASNNTALGRNSLNLNDTGYDNVAVGRNSLDANTSGHSNTSVGESSLTSNTTGDRNIAIGQNSMAVNTTGSENVAIGRNALDANTTASNNTAVGDSALSANTTGTGDVAIGHNSLVSNTEGSQQVAVGKDSMYSNTTGYNNTAVGWESMKANTTGYLNVAVGQQAMLANTEGYSNVAVGHNSYASATTANHNTCVGDNAGASITVGQGNTCIGADAGDAISGSNGKWNTAVGFGALGSTTAHFQNTAVGQGCLSSNTAHGNTGVGAKCLEDNTSGSGNNGFGYFSLNTVTTGDDNVAMGTSSGQKITTGDNNSCFGNTAGQDITTGVSNTCIGYQTGKDITTGSQNTLVGYANGATGLALTTGGQNMLFGTFNDTTAADASHCHGFGYNLDCAPDFTTLGNATLDSRLAHGGTTWSTISDIRVKKDIEDSKAGLAFINDLRPVTFNYKNLGDIPKEFKGYEEGSTEAYRNSKRQHGFIAQEVKEAIDNHPEIVDGFKMWHELDHNGQQEVGEGYLIPMLTKAIQELSAEIEELKLKLN